jgi:hypothetical protein
MVRLEEPSVVELVRISYRLTTLFIFVNTAKKSGFYTTFVPKEPGPKKRRTTHEFNQKDAQSNGHRG